MTSASTTMRAAMVAALLALGIALLGIAAPWLINDSRADEQADRLAHWQDIATLLFGDRALQNGDAVIALDAPGRADDAALVPMTISVKDGAAVKGVYLVIDENPAPVAAHFVFGPAADPSQIKLRVRVNAYTNVHAVAEMQDGRLLETTRFVKASGGCSAPMDMSEQEAMKGMGEMRLKLAGEVTPGKPAEAVLMVRHPNFNGMQMNQVSRLYTPARYIQSLTVTDGAVKVFDLEADISLAANPVIGFRFIPQAEGELKVAVTDSDKGHWEKSFPVPAPSN